MLQAWLLNECVVQFVLFEILVRKLSRGYWNCRISFTVVKEHLSPFLQIEVYFTEICLSSVCSTKANYTTKLLFF